MSSVTDDICDMLDSYGGRDKVVRLACYSLKLYGCLRGDKGWQKAGSQLSHARMLLRLFDDLPTLMGTLSYGLGKHEPTLTDAALGVLANLVDQLFLPVEKVLWFQELGILKFSPKTAEALDTTSTVLWAAGLYLGLFQTLQSIQRLLWTRDCLQQSEDKCSDAKKKLDVRIMLQFVTAGKLCLDITQAVSCLPAGWLWGERIGATKVAAIATSSSVLSLASYVCKLWGSTSGREGLLRASARLVAARSTTRALDDAAVVLSLASYVCKLWGSTSGRDGLLRASARLVAARSTTRTLDDAAVVKTFVQYGLGQKDGPFWGPLGVAGCVSTLAYLQVDKLLWLIDCGLVTVSKDTDYKCRVAHKLFWALYSAIGLVRSIRELHKAAEELKSPKRRKCASARFTQASLFTTKLLCDVIHTVSYLPEGYLWGGRLSMPQASGAATVSAVLALDGPFWGPLGVAGCVSTLAYLQVDKVLWLIDCGLINVSKDTDYKCRVAHKLFWALYSAIGLIRSIRELHKAAEELKSPKRRKCASARFTQASLFTSKLLCDVIHTVSYLPEGYLWGGRLSMPQASGAATVSAVLALVHHYHAKRLAPVS
ncbi:unnamed protein product [Plutella xylostella]|uniref:(diamondback moth) hypothetical protein n=1 Tax=Plutella xylostella TaxID=51655 RepID=A0A8S4GEA8_PLUXY|nr:unnamed protein product [Plutella xylostella]